MIDRYSPKTVHRKNLAGLFVLFTVAPGVVHAHEGHPAIPTTGAVVHGDELLLSEGALQAIGLTTAKVTLADMPTYVRANGTITVPWRQQCYVTTLLSGVVDAVFVRPGDEVQQGQVLARISSLELEQIQLDLLQANSDLDHFSDMYARRKPLSKSGAIFATEFLEATHKREEAASRFQVATTKLKALGFDDDTMKHISSTGETVREVDIRSPMQGALVHADIRAGQSVDREQHLFHVVNNAIVWCIADVLETDSGPVETGQPATVEVTSLGGPARQGRVNHIALTVDPDKRAIPVVIELENHDLSLRPGMAARIAVQVAKSEQAVVCPRESLIRFAEDRCVLLKRGEGKFIRRKVELGRSGTTHVEVLRGVFPGDHVAASGAHLLGSLFDRTTAEATEIDASQQDPAKQKLQDDSQLLTATGVVELPTSAKVFATSRVDGRITRIFVKHSQVVKKGDPLAELESVQLFDLQLELVEQNLERRWTERHLAQLEAISSSGTIPQVYTRQLQNDLRKLEQKVAILTRRLVAYGLAEEQMSRLLAADGAEEDIAELVSKTVTIRAPQAGLIAHFDLAQGRIVNAHDHQLFEIHDPSQFWVKAYLFGHQAGAIAIGQRAEVRVAADPTFRASGRIVRIAPMSAEAQRVFPVWIELEQSAGSLREGMLARLLIHATPVVGVGSQARVGSSPAREGD